MKSTILHVFSSRCHEISNQGISSSSPWRASLFNISATSQVINNPNFVLNRWALDNPSLVPSAYLVWPCGILCSVNHRDKSYLLPRSDVTHRPSCNCHKFKGRPLFIYGSIQTTRSHLWFKNAHKTPYIWPYVICFISFTIQYRVSKRICSCTLLKPTKSHS